jgi:hypothetical protein
MSTITTPNILEIAYLLKCHHRIIEVGTQAGWPYGIEELAVTLEGENIDLDHQSFMRHAMTGWHQLSEAFAAIQSVIGRQSDDAAFAGVPYGFGRPCTPKGAIAGSNRLSPEGARS